MIHLQESELQWERRKGSLFFLLEMNEGNSSTRLLGRRNQCWSFGQSHELPSPSDWTGKKAEMWEYRRTQSGDGCTLECQSQLPLRLYPCPESPLCVCVCVLTFYFLLQLINNAVLFQVHSKVLQTVPLCVQTALCCEAWSGGFLELSPVPVLLIGCNDSQPWLNIRITCEVVKNKQQEQNPSDQLNQNLCSGDPSTNIFIKLPMCMRKALWVLPSPSQPLLVS